MRIFLVGCLLFLSIVFNVSAQEPMYNCPDHGDLDYYNVFSFIISDETESVHCIHCISEWIRDNIPEVEEIEDNSLKVL